MNYGYNYPSYYPQNVQPPINKATLQGRLIDNVDVARNIEFPLDGSISYFPLADGSAIVTKKIQIDGTSKMLVYKPIIQAPEEPYSPKDDIQLFREELNTLKEEVKALQEKDTQ